MTISIDFKKTPQNKDDAAVALVYSDGRLSASAETLDKELDKLISHHVDGHLSFKGKKGQILSLTAPADASYKAVILIGTGDAEKFKADDAENAGGKLYKSLKANGCKTASFFIEEDQSREGISSEDLAARVASGLTLRAYKFDKYKTKKAIDDKKHKDFDVEKVTFVMDKAGKAQDAFGPLYAATQGTLMARSLVNEPPNELYPESFAKMVKDELKPLGIEVDVFDEKKMEKLGFHSHMAVGKASVRKPRVVVLKWNGSKDKNAAPVAFVGKGVTFDTGGYNLKPTSGMGEMKMDMGGAAAVSGLMKTLALRDAKVNAIGVLGLAENMISDNGYRPSDVIGSYSGKTIEVMNTDAEGRLVMVDSISYVQDIAKPKFVIDVATLTGAIMVALGYKYCGTFSNNDDLWDQLNTASASSLEKLWRMPLDEIFTKQLESHIADIRHMGADRMAGASTAAAFLESFIEDDTPWAHLDIAGTAWQKSESDLGPKEGTGFGVRVLDRLVAENYED